MTPRLRAVIAAVTATVAGAVTAASMVVTAPGAAAAPGTWGAGHYPYLDGVVCTSSNGTSQVTSPLVAWDLGSGRTPGFTTAALTSDGATDSAAPPLPSVGSQSATAVAPGVDGFTSDADIATYAALVSRFGSAGGDTTAQVADAIVRKTSGSSPGCVDTAQESALVAQAQQLAGPYTLTFAHPSAKLRPAAPQPVSVTLTSAAGQPVPGATVSFAGPSVTFAATQATTDANGVATVQAAVVAGTTAATVRIQAQVALPTGLQLVNAQGTPSPTDPTGAIDAAVAAAPPVPVTAAATLPVDQSADPVVHLSLPDTALDVGTATTPKAVVTGLYGHRANVVFTVHGPVPLRSGSLCSGRTAADAGSAVTATSQVTVAGDSTVSAGSWQPDRPGCYWVSAALTTLNAVPTAKASATSGTAITVLDTSVTLDVTHSLVGAGGTVTGTATVTHGYGLSSSLQVRLLGPVQPDPDATSCRGVDFSSAPTQPVGTDRTATDSTGSRGTGSGPPGFSATTAAPGCYQLAGALLVDVPGSTAMRVPIDATSAAPQVLAVHPQVSYAMNQVWSYEHGSVSAAVTVIGTYNQPVRVALRTARTASPTLDCRDADYAGAQAGPPGDAVATRQNLATVTVTSAPLAQAGCYSAVPELTMDGNPAVTASGSFDALAAAVAVGPNPAIVHDAAPAAAPTRTGGPARPLVAALLFLLLCLVALSFALHTARRMAGEQQREATSFLLE